MPRLATLALAAGALAGSAAAIRFPNVGGLQDLAAYPKYEVVFLNDYPLSASDAARCRAEGLVNDDDFMVLHPRSRVTIEAEAAARTEESGGETDKEGEGSERGEAESTPPPSASLELLTLHYTHRGETGSHPYLCALPSANRTAAQTATAAQPHDEPEPDAAASWLALSHLDGQCLYARHMWFTYAYCHNRFIRQFRAAEVTVPAGPEGHIPKEDPIYDAYTLGHAHPKRKGTHGAQKRKGENRPPDAAALAPEQTATFGVGPASRYLVQRWTDGTRCDKTGQPREVEVQVHCSMTSGDAIYTVKEVEICKYVVVIHSPHLCSLPGFRPQTADDIVSVPIRCREIVDDEEFARWEAEPEEKRKQNDLLRLPERQEETTGAEQPPVAGGPEAGKIVAKPGTGKTGDLEADEELIKRLENILSKAFGGNVVGDLADLGIDVEVQHVGLGEELVPKQVKEGGAADPPAAERKKRDSPLMFISYDPENGGLKTVVTDSEGGAEGDAAAKGDRRAMLERLQRMIASELAETDGGEKQQKEQEGKRAKDEL